MICEKSSHYYFDAKVALIPSNHRHATLNMIQVFFAGDFAAAVIDLSFDSRPESCA